MFIYYSGGNAILWSLRCWFFGFLTLSDLGVSNQTVSVLGWPPLTTASGWASPVHNIWGAEYSTYQTSCQPEFWMIIKIIQLGTEDTSYLLDACDCLLQVREFLTLDNSVFMDKRDSWCTGVFRHPLSGLKSNLGVSNNFLSWLLV